MTQQERAVHEATIAAGRAAEDRLRRIARTRRPTEAEREEACAAYAAAAEAAKKLRVAP